MEVHHIEAFPLAAVTSHNKLDGLKHTSLLSDNPAGHKSKTVVIELKSKCWQNCVPSGGSRDISIFSPFSIF